MLHIITILSAQPTIVTPPMDPSNKHHKLTDCHRLTTQLNITITAATSELMALTHALHHTMTTAADNPLKLEKIPNDTEKYPRPQPTTYAWPTHSPTQYIDTTYHLQLTCISMQTT